MTISDEDGCFGCIAKLEYIDVLKSEINRLQARDKQMAEAILSLADRTNRYVLSTHDITKAVFDEVDSLVDYCEKLENMVIARDSQIKILEVQVAALKKIAEEERAAMLACAEDLHGIDEGHLIEARRQLSEEHPEIDWE